MIGSACRGGIVAVLAVASFGLASASAQAAVNGSLSQLPVPNNCIEPGTEAECGTTNGAGIQAAQAVAVSPDGKNVYVIGNGDAIAEFARHSDGSLTQLGGGNNCISEFSTQCGTHNAKGLQNPQAIVVSGDGKNVYVVGHEDNNFGTVAEFKRNSDGSLTQLTGSDNCIEEQGGKSCGTTTGHGIADVSNLTIAPDGKTVYTTDIGGPNYDGAVAEFSRDPSTGALTELGCIVESKKATTECATSGKGVSFLSTIVVSSDNNNVYTGEQTQPGAIAEFARSPVDGSLTELGCIQDASATMSQVDCTSHTAIGINDVHGMDLSPDGKNLYSASFDFNDGPIAEFSRDSTTGLLSQLPSPNNCIEEHGSSPAVGCGNQTGRGLKASFDIKVSPDGQNAYLVGQNSNALAEFARNSDGSLTQLANPNDCIQETGFGAPDCGTTTGRGLNSPQALAVAPDGANVYVASPGCVDPCVSSVAEFARVLPPPPPAPQSSTPPPASQPQTSTPPPAKTAVKAVKKKRHHKRKKAHKAVKAKRVARPRFTG